MVEHISIIRAGCERRGSGTSGRTAGSRAARASARSALRFRACAPICLEPLALASRGLLRCALVLVIAGSFAASGCKDVQCDVGTIEKNGKCEPADETTGTAQCGPNTMLEGTLCVPTFPPTVCDPSTTTMDTGSDGVVTCIGTGGGGCSSPFACPQPAQGKTTICGQIYDFETNLAFAVPSASGAMCTPGATSGPCALTINAYDAIAFGQDPSTAQPLANGGVEIDDCGRYRIKDVAQPASPFIGLGFDDADAGNLGPPGVTNTVGVALSKQPDVAVKGLEAWIVKSSTTDVWAATGGPSIAGGIYVGVFRSKHGDPPIGDTCSGSNCLDTAAGVTMTKSGSAQPANDYYFVATSLLHQMIDPAAVATGQNGTGLLTGASVNDSIIYGGTGGLTDAANCQWKSHAAASLPGIVFIQIYRPVSQIGKTCTQ